MRLRDADLNLLVAFDALMRECHVTRAANLLVVGDDAAGCLVVHHEAEVGSRLS